MDVFIYFDRPLPLPRGVIEDAVDEALGERGEVTGAGGGARGDNIDIEIYDDADKAVILLIKQVLRDLNVPSDTFLVVDGERHSLENGRFA